jgi:hypothetical protein
MSRSKTLISGCGISWSGQDKKTWVKILKIAGAEIVDLGGPAVSNQWIINQIAAAVMDRTDVSRVILQLTSLGKLDVAVNDERLRELVCSDSVRNFTFQGIWPSSGSVEHESKRLWHRWLYSPRLEIQDLAVKLRLLDSYCKSVNIEMIVIQGYEIPWQEHGYHHIETLIDTATKSLYQQYLASERYQHHDHALKNTVPELGWQINLASSMCERFWPCLMHRMQRISRSFYENST